MKHFYVIRALNEGQHVIHIVKAFDETSARGMIPNGHQILEVTDKGLIENDLGGK